MIQDVNIGAFGVDGSGFCPPPTYDFSDAKIWMEPSGIHTSGFIIESWQGFGKTAVQFIRRNPGPIVYPKNYFGIDESYFQPTAGYSLYNPDFTNFNFLHNGSPFTIYGVSKLDSPGTGANWVIGNANNASFQTGFEIWENAIDARTIRIAFKRLNSNPTRLTDMEVFKTVADAFKTKSFCFKYDGLSTVGSVNDAKILSTRTDVGTPSIANATDHTSIGNVGTFGAFYRGSIFELIFFDKLHSDSETVEILRILNTKYRVL